MPWEPLNFVNHEPRIYDDSPCKGAQGCELCRTCSRFTSRPKDKTFILTPPGHRYKCGAYHKIKN